jgi:hypothetical protein
MRIASSFVLVFALLTACEKQPATPDTATPGPTTEETPPPAASEGDAAERPGITAAACEAQGGKVVGDIGDGAIHRPEYKCAESGEAPIGSIIPDAGGPVAIEGSVCCK